MQYQDLGIPEYWIVDPQEKSILILELSGDGYTEVNTFRNDEVIRSPQFKFLNVTASQILLTNGEK